MMIASVVEAERKSTRRCVYESFTAWDLSF